MNEKLHRLIADVFAVPPNQINEQTTVEDLQSWDSLKHLQLIIALEQAYGIQLDTEEIPQIQSVSDIQETLRRHGMVE